RGERGIAQDVDALHRLRFHGAPVHVAPAVVGGDETGLGRDVAGAVRWHYVEYVGLHVLDLEPHRHRGAVYGHRARVAAVLDDSRVQVRPGALEERTLGGHVRIGVEHQHLGARFRLFEVGRNYARTLVGPGRTAVRRER